MKITKVLARNLERQRSIISGTEGRNQTTITVSKGSSYTANLDVIKLIGTFSKSVALASGLFTTSASKTFTVAQTFRVGDPSKISALAYFERYNRYEVDQYDVIDYGYTTRETYTGSGIIEESNLVFVDVIYP